MPTTMPPVHHPGEILLADFLEPLCVTQHRLTVSIGVPRGINEIVHGKRRISADTALRLARFFGTSERFWINLASPLRPRSGARPARTSARRHNAVGCGLTDAPDELRPPSVHHPEPLPTVRCRPSNALIKPHASQDVLAGTI